ncbi:MAG: PID-CTERM protein-sorting domain-containing protein [Cytophagales bacterium]
MPPEGPPDEEIPIDGGVGLLIAAGIAVGSKMLYKKNKNQA